MIWRRLTETRFWVKGSRMKESGSFTTDNLIKLGQIIRLTRLGTLGRPGDHTHRPIGSASAIGTWLIGLNQWRYQVFPDFWSGRSEQYRITRAAKLHQNYLDTNAELLWPCIYSQRQSYLYIMSGRYLWNNFQNRCIITLYTDFSAPPRSTQGQ